MTSEERLESIKEARRLLNLLPSIGQTIGTLNQRLRRCRINSERYQRYDTERQRLLTEQSDIIFDVKLTLFHLLTEEEQKQFVS
jgi:uroporphyrinogen-III synthase